MEFEFADVGEGIQDGVIVQWHARPGDTVEADEVLVEVETDKAVVEIPAPCSGVVESLGAEKDETIEVGEVLAVIDDRGDVAQDDDPSDDSTHGENDEDAGTVVGVLDDSDASSGGAEPKNNDASAESENRPQRATPAVRRFAREHDIDLANVSGSGDKGRVMLDDVRSYTQKQAEDETDDTDDKEDGASPATGGDEAVDYDELSPTRRSIARTMDESNERPQVTHMDECNVTALKHTVDKSDHTTTPFLVRAMVKTLKEHPIFNACADDEFVRRDSINIGVAVDTDDGLMVPVVQHADDYTVDGLSRRINGLSTACQNRSIDREKLRGGTFTVTNIGFIGGTWATPLILPPQVAIVATGRMREKPVANDGAITTGWYLPVSLSFDHRFIDGADAARFVATLREHLQEPSTL